MNFKNMIIGTSIKRIAVGYVAGIIRNMKGQVICFNDKFMNSCNEDECLEYKMVS